MAWYNENNFINDIVIEDSDSGELKTLKTPTAGCVTDHDNVRLYIDGVSGDDTNTGLDSSNALKTLNKVTEMMNNGRTDMRLIFLRGGVYVWNATIFNAVSMHWDSQAPSGEQVIVQFNNVSSVHTYKNVVMYNSHINVCGTSTNNNALGIKITLLDKSGKLYLEGCTVNFGSAYGAVNVDMSLFEFYGCSGLIHYTTFGSRVVFNGTRIRLNGVHFDVPDGDGEVVRIDRDSYVDMIGQLKVNSVSNSNPYPFIYCLRSTLHLEFSSIETDNISNNKFSNILEQHGGWLEIAKDLVNSDIVSGSKLYSAIATNGAVMSDGCVYAYGVGISDSHNVNKTELPIASAEVLGGVKIGSGLSITSDGTLSTGGSEVFNYDNISIYNSSGETTPYGRMNKCTFIKLGKLRIVCGTGVFSESDKYEVALKEIEPIPYDQNFVYGVGGAFGTSSREYFLIKPSNDTCFKIYFGKPNSTGAVVTCMKDQEFNFCAIWCAN